MNYDELARLYAVRLCTGCTTYAGRHEQGLAVIGGILHWRARRVTRPGLRRFLKLVARVQLGSDSMREPHKTFWECYLADGMAKDLHVRFPRRYADLDRARVRAAMVGVGLDKETRRIMEQWVR